MMLNVIQHRTIYRRNVYVFRTLEPPQFVLGVWKKEEHVPLETHLESFVVMLLIKVKLNVITTNAMQRCTARANGLGFATQVCLVTSSVQIIARRTIDNGGISLQGTTRTNIGQFLKLFK
jgi:hypothetical protein